MSSLLMVLAGITILFFTLFLIRQILSANLKKKFCVICGAVVLTWTALLGLLWFELFDDKIIIGILIGESILGIFYVVESYVKEELKIFRLPFLLTMVTLAYFILAFPKDFLQGVLFLISLWTFFILIYAFKAIPNVNKFIKKLVECCRRW